MSIPEPEVADHMLDLAACIRDADEDEGDTVYDARIVVKMLARRCHHAERQLDDLSARAIAAEADAGRLAEEVAAVNENHYAMKGEPCTCSGCDRRRAALAAHAGTAAAGRYKCGCPVVPSDEIEAFCPTHREPMTR